MKLLDTRNVKLLLNDNCFTVRKNANLIVAGFVPRL